MLTAARRVIHAYVPLYIKSLYFLCVYEPARIKARCRAAMSFSPQNSFIKCVIFRLSAAGRYVSRTM